MRLPSQKSHQKRTISSSPLGSELLRNLVWVQLACSQRVPDWQSGGRPRESRPYSSPCARRTHAHKGATAEPPLPTARKASATLCHALALQRAGMANRESENPAFLHLAPCRGGGFPIFPNQTTAPFLCPGPSESSSVLGLLLWVSPSLNDHLGGPRQNWECTRAPSLAPATRHEGWQPPRVGNMCGTMLVDLPGEER